MTFCTACGRQTVETLPLGDNAPRDVCPGCGFIHYENPGTTKTPEISQVTAQQFAGSNVESLLLFQRDGNRRADLDGLLGVALELRGIDL
jgi:hypothetical protein